jgi:hypothetical protein
MKMRQWLPAVGFVVVSALGAGCTGARPCRTVEPLRGDTRPWPNFTDSERFLKTWLGGDLDSLQRTAEGIASSTYCDAVNFPAALERFWFLIR